MGPPGPQGQDGARGAPGQDGADAFPFAFTFVIPGDLTTPDRTYRVMCTLAGCDVNRTET